MRRIFNQKINGISKQSGISDFLNKHRDIHKIIIVKSITTKAEQHIRNNYSNSEIFLESYLMSDLIGFVLAPRYEVLDRNSDEYKTFYEHYQCKKRNVPKINITINPIDPMAKYYNLKKNDIVRVIRPSETSGESAFYRLAV